MEYLEMLARLGVGSAHPGGFTATLRQLEQFPIPAGSRVLEIGCGTGRTACHLAKMGCIVTAVDIRPDMVKKAVSRASRENVDVRFQEADASSLPFDDGSFDVVMLESVTVFTDSRKTLGEYFRVLKEGGRLFDREIIAWEKLQPALAKEVSEFYGVPDLYTVEEWKALLTGAGFKSSEIWQPQAFPENAWEDSVNYPDLLQEPDGSAWMDPGLWQTAMRYDEIMLNNRETFGFALMIGNKQG